MTCKHWHAMGLAVVVGVATTFAVGASSGPDSIEFWTGEQLTLVLQRPLSDTMYWRLTEGVTVAVMALPGLVLALLVYGKARGELYVPVGQSSVRELGFMLRSGAALETPRPGHDVT